MEKIFIQLIHLSLIRFQSYKVNDCKTKNEK